MPVVTPTPPASSVLGSLGAFTVAAHRQVFPGLGFSY
jgi:hypothetical protein